MTTLADSSVPQIAGILFAIIVILAWATISLFRQ